MVISKSFILNQHNFSSVVHFLLFLMVAKWQKKANTLKKSYKRPPHIFSSNSESKILSIKIHNQINKPMSYSGSVSFCIPKCAIYLTQTKHK